MNSAASLHLNQAGGVVVGWFSGPPRWVQRVSPTVSRAPGTNDRWLVPGVLVAHLTGTSWSDGAPCYWVQSTASPSSASPTVDLMVLDNLDPPDALGDDARIGYLRWRPPDMGPLFQEVLLMLHWVGRQKDDFAGYDRFMRVSTEARLPNFLIQQMPSGVQAELHARQCRPLPTSVANIAKAKVTKSDERGDSAASLLRAWFLTDSSSRTLRKIRREAVVEFLISALDPKATPAGYRSAAYDPVRVQMENETLTIKSVKQSYMQWYRALAGEVLAAHREIQVAHPQTAPIEAEDPHVKALAQMGLMPQGDFLYTLSFSSTSAALEGLLARALGQARPSAGADQLPPGPVTAAAPSSSLKSMLDVVKLSGGVFKLNIKKEKVKLRRRVDGNLELKDGEAVITSRTTVWDTGQHGVVDAMNDGFVGVFGEIGSGLGFTVRSAAASAGSGLSSIAMLSTLDLEREDFVWAQLSSVLLAGPQLGLGAIASVNFFSSRLVQVTLPASRGGFALSATETRAMSTKFIELNDLRPTLSTDLATLGR